jgi:hypothetical protein
MRALLCCYHALLLHTLLSHLVASLSRLVVICCHTLLLALATLPLLPYHSASLHLVALLPAIFKNLLPPSHCCFVVLLLILVPCYFALSVGTPSSFFCAGGGAWNITNKLHPTTDFFFSPNFSSFFFLCFVCCLFLFLFVIFVLS